MQKILPFLWFDGRAEEAALHYARVIDGCRVVDTLRMPAGGPAPAGAVLSVTFEIAGQPFVALNGGPQYQFTPAISFMIVCQTQDEIDRQWHGLLQDGGKPVQCGWLCDRYGVSWQVVPAALQDMLRSADAARAGRVMAAMMPMVKLDLAALQAAYEGR